MTRPMAKEFTFIRMVLAIQANGTKINSTVLESKSGQTMLFTKVNIVRE